MLAGKLPLVLLPKPDTEGIEEITTFEPRPNLVGIRGQRRPFGRCRADERDDARWNILGREFHSSGIVIGYESVQLCDGYLWI